MTKICKNCNHKKGDHCFYTASNEEGLFCNCKKCGCVDFEEEKNNG